MRRQSIFIKIYLSFWLSIILVLVTQITLDRLTQTKPLRPIHHAVGVSLALYGQAALDHHLRGDHAGLENITEQLRNSTGISAFLLNQANREVNGRPLPVGVAELGRHAIESGRPEMGPARPPLMLAKALKGGDGKQYAVVGHLPRSAFGPPHGDLLHLMMRLSIVLLISGVVCYWLARCLTAPVITLGEATRRFAAGEMGVRIGNRSGKKDEISELADDFDRMAERIESLIILQRQLLGDISHELRSPLARLNVALALARRQTGPEAAKALDRIEQETESLNVMIGQILTLTRLENGIEGVHMAPLDITSLVRQIAADGEFEAHGSNRAVRLLENEQLVVHGSEELLRRAIENVLRNAIHYTGEHTAVEISLSMSSHHPAPSVEITILDHGPGVPEADLENLFRPFFRVSDARERQTGGTGLGLAITERAVRLHNGSIKASNADEGGLAVVISLPLDIKPIS